MSVEVTGANRRRRPMHIIACMDGWNTTDPNDLFPNPRTFFLATNNINSTRISLNLKGGKFRPCSGRRTDCIGGGGGAKVAGAERVGCVQAGVILLRFHPSNKAWQSEAKQSKAESANPACEGIRSCIQHRQ